MKRIDMKDLIYNFPRLKVFIILLIIILIASKATNGILAKRNSKPGEDNIIVIDKDDYTESVLIETAPSSSSAADSFLDDFLKTEASTSSEDIVEPETEDPFSMDPSAATKSTESIGPTVDPFYSGFFRDSNDKVNIKDVRDFEK